MNGMRYTKTVILADEFLKDTRNCYRFVSQSKYKGSDSKDGKPGLKPGANIVLQIMYDDAPPIIDKETKQPMENSVLDTFMVTIPNVEYPLPLKKGDFVSLENFLSDHSYFIKFNLILRFGGYKKLQPQTQGGSNNATNK